jgi:hypothetical protein
MPRKIIVRLKAFAIAIEGVFVLLSFITRIIFRICGRIFLSYLNSIKLFKANSAYTAVVE